MTVGLDVSLEDNMSLSWDVPISEYNPGFIEGRKCYVGPAMWGNFALKERNCWHVLLL